MVSEQKLYLVHLDGQVVAFLSYITQTTIMIHINVANKVDHDVFKNIFASYMIHIHRIRVLSLYNLLP